MKLIALLLALFLETISRLVILREEDKPDLKIQHSGGKYWIVVNVVTDQPIHQGTFLKEDAEAIASGKKDIPEDQLLTAEQKMEQAKELAEKAEADAAKSRAAERKEKEDPDGSAIPPSPPSVPAAGGGGDTGTGVGDPKPPKQKPAETGGESGPEQVVQGALGKFAGAGEDVGEVIRIAETPNTGRKVTVTTKGYVTGNGQFVTKEDCHPDTRAHYWPKGGA